MALKVTNNQSWLSFGILMVFILTVASLYFYNVIKWADQPIVGFFFRSGSTIHVVGGVLEEGRQAGLLPGDRILSINGKKFQTIKERRAIRNYDPHGKNSYVIGRGNEKLNITINNIPKGFWKTFQVSGFPFLAGLCYVTIGTLIFLMRPHKHESWVFFIFTSSLGLLMTFLFRYGVLNPCWLNTIHIFLYSFTPGAVLHLALSVPVKRNLIIKHPLVEFLPYAASLILFIGLRSSASEMQAVSRTWYLTLLSYFVPALIVYLSSCLYLWLRSSSEIVRARAKVILLGAVIATSIPVIDMLLCTFFGIYLVPNFNYYLPFLIVFPLSVGYAIIKHNLFDITAAIRQTFGYLILSTSIIILYFLVVVILSHFLGDIWQKKSHFVFLAILMIIMSAFGFLRKRVQIYVDRIFFRIDFDYRETVSQIGTAMRSLLNINQVVAFMRDIAKNVVYAGKSYVMLLNREKNVYECAAESCSVTSLPAGEPLIMKIAEQKREITRYDIDENPLFAIDRERCKKTFDSLGASLIVPLIYEDHLSGFMALGKKKSGKVFKYEDVLLLMTLANQGAMAIENARLFTDLEGQTETLLNTNIKLEREIDQRKKIEAELNQYKHRLENKVERQTIELDRSRKALADLKGDIKRGHRFGKIIGKSELMQAIYALIEDLVDVSATVLVTGESGTGKELVAEALHSKSQRKAYPFVKVNCSALSESVLESELFGHVKGAFTGADTNKIGRFQKAANGTILLDEIGDVSLNFQKRLLRVLQEREFERLGDTTTLSMDARIIAATNQNLLERVKQGEFRQDLYYRLKVVEIKLPPLRERKEDIPLLINHFLQIFNEDLAKQIKTVSPEVLRILMAYHWPGNIRELRNTLEHICILCKNKTIVEDDLPSDFPGADLSYDQSFQSLSNPPPIPSETVPVDKKALLKALEQTQWNKTRAAEVLGISRRTLYRRLKEYQI